MAEELHNGLIGQYSNPRAKLGGGLVYLCYIKEVPDDYFLWLV